MSITPAERDLRRDDVLTAVQSLLLVIVVATFVITFLLQPFRIPSPSMDPTLRVGDFLLMNKQAFAPRGPLDGLLPFTPVRRGDVVVFHYPVDPAVHFVKRVVGLPGDRLHLHDGHLFVNGHAISEPYAFYGVSIPDSFRDNFPTLNGIDADIDPAWWATLQGNVRDGELNVPPGHYFVMGDNRNDSIDSRYWGFVPQTALVGRPLVVYFSLGQDPAKVSWVQRLKNLFKNPHLVR